MRRDPALQSFVDALLAAYAEVIPGAEAADSLERIAAALGSPGTRRERAGGRLPVCAHLDAALGVEPGRPSLRRLVEAFRGIEPDLEWVRRASHDETASENFADGHANAMILGPAGLENRRDIWIGVSLLAPHVRYTDHSHAPEETYLVLSPGAFRHGRRGIVPQYAPHRPRHAIGRGAAFRVLGALGGPGRLSLRQTVLAQGACS